jgi:hypothetical protein
MLDHVDNQFQFHGASIACRSKETPLCRRPGFKSKERLPVEGRDESVGIHPHSNAFDENMAVYRQ